jgi:hypothetical protein
VGIGAFTATWSLVVSMVQTFAAPLLLRALRCLPPKASHGWPWALCLLLVSLCVAIMFTVSVVGSTNNGGGSATIINAVLVPGVFLWAACFAVMQTVHVSLALALCAELPPPVVQSGLLAAASAGRIVGVLVGSALFTFYYAFNVPVGGVSFNVTFTSFSACLWAGTVASLLVFLLSFVIRALLASARPAAVADADASQEEAGGTRARGVPTDDSDEPQAASSASATSVAVASPATAKTAAAAAAAIADAIPGHL